MDRSSAGDASIANISDTARWVAVYRAMETERPDAIFRDPYAARLAGERGRAIVDAMPHGRERAWPMIVRTAVFDEIILELVLEPATGSPVDLVLNLAAGLDARAWRLALPPTLRWVDVDLPEILRYKTEMLQAEPTSCLYETVPMDLRDESVRRALFTRLGAESKRALVITEGLLIYLSAEQVGALARDLNEPPSFHWWLIDLASPLLLKIMEDDWGKSVKAGNAPFQFAPAEGPKFFEPYGWTVARFRSTLEDSQRLQRGPPEGSAPPPQISPDTPYEELRRLAGQVLLERR